MAAASFAFACFSFTSFTAALIASSANMEQCNFTGGKFKWLAISLFLICVLAKTLIDVDIHIFFGLVLLFFLKHWYIISVYFIAASILSQYICI